MNRRFAERFSSPTIGDGRPFLGFNRYQPYTVPHPNAMAMSMTSRPPNLYQAPPSAAGYGLAPSTFNVAAAAAAAAS
uniref:Uncharacterized protein n=1 Tax=Romanomermis culicivorax TaxID=13658 RepID=A0A915K6R4_ROMCU